MNTMHLYGNIVDVFEGKIVPSRLTKDAAGIAESLRFGLGVSCFQEDLANIGDAVFFDGRFFIRSTDDGQRRDSFKRKFKEDRAGNYRTVYSLGITKHPLEMRKKSFLAESACPAGFSVEDLISRIIGAPRAPGSAPRTFGFLALLEYECNYSTSLSVAPIHGENIIPLMRKYARESHPQPGVSGLAMGFVRDRTQAWDDDATKMLGVRLFFDNPKDNEREAGPETLDPDLLAGPHWISHTHGLRLRAGQSVFAPSIPREAQNHEELFRRMTADESLCRSVIEQGLNQNDLDDCGHVIPRSTLRRYFAVAFPVESITAS